jgi:hypothetical protein
MQKRPSGRHKRPSGRHKKPTGNHKTPSGEPRKKRTTSGRIKIPGKKKKPTGALKTGSKRTQKRKKQRRKRQLSLARKDMYNVWKDLDNFIDHGIEPKSAHLRKLKERRPADFDQMLITRTMLRDQAKKFVSGSWKPGLGEPLYRLIMESPSLAKQLLRQAMATGFREELGEKYDEVISAKEYDLRKGKKPVREVKKGRFHLEMLYERLSDYLNMFRQSEQKKARKAKKEEEPKGE